MLVGKLNFIDLFPCSAFIHCLKSVDSFFADLDVEACFGQVTMLDEIGASSKVPTLQGLVHSGSTEPVSSAVLLQNALPQGEQGREPESLAFETGKSQSLARAGGSGGGASLAQGESGLLATLEAQETGTLQDDIAPPPRGLIFMDKCFPVCCRETTRNRDAYKSIGHSGRA